MSIFINRKIVAGSAIPEDILLAFLEAWDVDVDHCPVMEISMRRSRWHGDVGNALIYWLQKNGCERESAVYIDFSK